MDKELLKSRLKELGKAMEQTLANYNMLEGGKQECLFLLKMIEENEVKQQGQDA